MTKQRIPENRIHGKRLGRNLNHDPRSRSFAIQSKASTAKTTSRKLMIDVLDQAATGSCTGNAKTHELGSEGKIDTAMPVLISLGYQLDESFARDVVYHLATVLDPYNGEYPPTDTGSDGLSVSKVTDNLGVTNGYVHALSLDAMITGLQDYAGIIGVNWYDSFDNPGADAVLQLPAGAKVRGGHEVCALNVDMELERIVCVQSWGVGWGRSGRFDFPFKVMERLLSEDGDATFSVPLSADPPKPNPHVVYSEADLRFKKALDSWGKNIISRHGTAGKLNAARKEWEAAHE